MELRGEKRTVIFLPRLDKLTTKPFTLLCNFKKFSKENKNEHQKRCCSVIIVGLLVGLMLVNIGFSQTKIDQPTGKTQPKIIPVTMSGKIINDEVSGGYIVIRQKPHEEYRIINVKDDILKDLANKGELVTIEGNLPRGAYFLVIEKINGKEYPR